ncbi:MAG TPA: hypothetical protein VIC06_15220 [Solirubrobacteraceae bacterium]
MTVPLESIAASPVTADGAGCATGGTGAVGTYGGAGGTGGIGRGGSDGAVAGSASSARASTTHAASLVVVGINRDAPFGS